jgi:hypothetical protein
LGRQADGLLLTAIVLAGLALNASLLYATASALERFRRAV